MANSGYSVTKIQRYGYLFVLPTLVFFSIFLIYPIVSAFILSFYQWNLLGPKVYVGFKNFVTMVSDERVKNSFLLTLHFSVISVAAINVLAFILAIMFSSNLIRFKNVLQSLVFLPVVLSIIAVGVVWEFMFQSTGLINILSRFFFGVTIPWLVDTRTAPYALIMVYVWKSVGYYMVIYIAGLLDVPTSLYESARMDGADS